jgi:transposase
MIDESNLPADIDKLKAIIGQQIVLRQQQIQSHQKEVCNFSAQIKSKNEEIKVRDEQIDILQEALRLARIARFASHSEKLPSNQSELFNEVEVFSTLAAEETEQSDNIEIKRAPAQNRNRPKRKPLPAHLPREEVIIDLSDEEKICAKDGSALKEIGPEISEALDIIPAQVKVIRTIRKKYVCPCCEDQANIKTAKLPESILPKTNATAGLLAYIATSKYIDALPMYRLEQIFKRYGVDIPRNTMCRWMIGLIEKLTPLYNMLEKDLLASAYIGCDETRVQVLNEDDKSPQSQSYMWVRTTHGPNINPIVLFDYDPTRKKEVPNKLLKGFKGFLQADAYAGYDEICSNPDVTRVGCMAHLRSNFVDVYKASEKKSRNAYMILKLIQELYKIEAEIKDKSIDCRKQTRLEKATPFLDEIKTWVDANQNKYPPTGLMGKAITYAANQWQYVINYLLDGRLDIDNNFTENRIRPFAIGRKNWLFSDSVDGAKASAMIYSILQTARGNGLEPYAYLRYLLTELPKCQTADQFEKLLPHKIDFKILN